MKSAFIFIIMLALSDLSNAESPKDQTISGPLGSKPIQLSIGSNGITQRKEPGYICDLDASMGGGHYSEWGQTEDDARSIVTKKCASKSGFFLCKKDKAVCKQEK